MRNRKAYPRNWPRLARACKEAARWHCQKCGVKHGWLRYSIWTGRYWPVYLQAAHINHDQENEAPELVAVCARCHWRYYRKPGASKWLYYERRMHQELIKRAWG